MRALTSAAIALLLPLAACAAPESSSDADASVRSAPPETVEAPPVETQEPAQPTLWTDEFMARTALLAEEVRIEGPVGVLDHVAMRPDPDFHDYVVETTPEGLRQVVSAKSADAPEIAAQLDGLQIKVLRRIVVLERPGVSEVVVRADGDVYWGDPASGKEERGPHWERRATVGP